jgi:hypothetical protein
MRRAAANYPPEAMYRPVKYDPKAFPTPVCCGRPMPLLYYEQTVATTGLSKAERVKWMAGGGKVTTGRGVRRWKATW